MEGPGAVLDPELLERLASLTVAARRAVAGARSGMHRSPHRGASVVFVEHREYRAGDDIRALDWRAFARLDRPIVKRYEHETQWRSTLVLDGSASMSYGAPITKADHAATLLGAIAFLLLQQGDATGAHRVATGSLEAVPARTRGTHLGHLLAALAVRPRKAEPTDLGASLDAVAEGSGRRGLVVIASDLLDLTPEGQVRERVWSSLERLAQRGHEVRVFQVLHPDELELPFEGPTRFVGLEGEGHVDADPDGLRGRYVTEVQRFVEECRTRCLAAGARHRLVRTDESIDSVLHESLTRSERRR